MKANAQLVFLAGLLVLSGAATLSAAIEPITGVRIGKSLLPPYTLQSVTVKDYTVTREFLATGTSTGRTILGTTIRSADDFDLNSVATRNDSGVWRVTKIGKKATWSDVNGEKPDFFVFEAGMDDSLSVQAILAGGSLGQAVHISSTTWGKTGLKEWGLGNMFQEIGGLAFAITDLLDAEGRPLGSGAVIEGIQFNSGDVDPAGFFAVVPEPATLAILGLGGLLLVRCRRS
jgi:hypothetical protein